jgi:multimeric flavodoxin WrbA
MNMKIALINGSPKAKESASEAVLQMLKPLLHDENEIIEYDFRKSMLNVNELEQIAECNALVFAFPLYVDGIPSHLLNCLYQMEAFFKTKPAGNLTVYSLVNCGFYEGQQASIALEIMKNWCDKAKLNWGQGIGIGGGGMLKILTGVPNGQGPKKNLWIALESIASNITAAAAADNIYISPNLPRFIYKLGAEAGWRQQIKANGLKRKDLFTKR